MAVFNLGCKVTVGAYTKVEADSLEAAIEIATSRDVVIGGINSGEYPEESWIISDADGLPTEISDEDA